MIRRLSIVAVVALPVLPATGPAVSRSHDAAPRIVLKSIQEVRRSELVKDPQEGFSFVKPGLVLAFDLDLASGRRVVEVLEPDAVKAVDSTGEDLTAIEPNFFGRRQHVEVIETYDGSSSEFKEFKFTLALPDRQASSVDLATSLQVVTDNGAREVVLDVGRDWTPIDPDLFPGKNVKARLKQGRENVELELVPGTVKGAIESIEVVSAGRSLGSYGTMWNDMQITYSFQGRLATGMKVKLRVRRGLETETIDLDLEDLPLP